MRRHAIRALALLLAVTTWAVSGEPAGTVILHQNGRSRDAKPVEDALRRLGVELLRSSNFNTTAHRAILNQSIPAIQDRYRQVVAGDCLIITYDHPVTMQTVGGDVSVFEIVIGLGRPDYADALFTIDNDGRVVAHGKYSGPIAIELRKAVSAAFSP